MTIIMCESPHQFHRASALASSMADHAANIMPVLSNAIPNSLLSGIIRKHFSNPRGRSFKVQLDGRKHQQNEIKEMMWKPMWTPMKLPFSAHSCENQDSSAKKAAADEPMKICVPEVPTKSNFEKLDLGAYEPAFLNLAAIFLQHGRPEQAADVVEDEVQ
eukprot:CAMPEP_0172766910 /NCGR_PEP_ID=MMETSP1074-20121228/182076_1 /TAXON_ID=2916 /ORGANISM="Ceratium fusus, Strain PA161109" /LENGTH=159 /DNA_ID=CAMNT_0013602093 /DNA_START=337 /DNA_END=816 /DNA_ORIENTATION=+